MYYFRCKKQRYTITFVTRLCCTTVEEWASGGRLDSKRDSFATQDIFLIYYDGNKMQQFDLHITIIGPSMQAKCCLDIAQ